MDFHFDDWKKALEDFKSSVSKDLEEIRRHKEEVRQIKEEIYSAKNSGYYLRDDHRIVLSAPEIIIGDVDRDGTLRATSGSQVVLRANVVGLDGVGQAGRVLTRAASIRQIAADPGCDGEEAVVGPLSEVVSQAGNIVLEGNGTSGIFSQPPSPSGTGSVRIHADGQLVVEASVSAENHQQELEEQIQQLEDMKSGLEKEISSCIKNFEKTAKEIEGVYVREDLLLSDVMVVRTEVNTLEDVEEMMDGYSASLYQSYAACANALSRLSEIHRRITCLQAEKKALRKPDEFKKESTGAAVSVVGERIDLITRDGDGNLRDNEGAGIGMQANDIRIAAVDKTGGLMEKGRVLLRGMGIEMSTVNVKDEDYDDDGKLKSGDYPAEGDILLRSKTVAIEAVDQEFKDDKIQEKALTKDGSISIRTEKMDISATDTEGKATGSIAFNAKEISARSMDVDKDKRTDDKLAAGSTMLLLSEKMFLGAKKKDIKSKKLQAASEEVGLFADKTFEAQQDDGKAALQLAGGKAALGGSDTQVFGKTVVNNTLEAKGEFKAPKATIDHVEAKSSFKSSNISDGIPIPPAPPSGNLSTKLKAEDAPEKK